MLHRGAGRSPAAVSEGGAVTFGIVIPPLLPPRIQVALAPVLEFLGFDRMWFPDHLLFPDQMPCSDPWTLMAAAAVRTRRIVFGTAVSDPHRVHPAVLAQRVATLDQLSRGRVILGLGSGEAMNLEPFGIPWDRRVGRLKEAITVIRRLLDSDEPFTFQGDFYQLRRARLSVRPWNNRRIPIYLAALGPMMQRLAGRVADGWIPVGLPAEHFREYHREMDEAARRAGRNPADITRSASLTFALTRRPEPVYDLLQEHALGMIWPPVARRMGLDLGTPRELADTHYITVNPCEPESRRRYEEHQRSIPRQVLERFVTVTDRVEDLHQAIAAYRAAGATDLKFTNASPDPLGSLLILAGEVIPRFRERPAPFPLRAAAAAAEVLRRAGLLPELDPRRGMRWLHRLSGGQMEHPLEERGDFSLRRRLP